VDITVTDAQLQVQHDGSGMWALALEITHDDGRTERIAHLMPESILEWRAAEYGMDPDSDREALLEMVLYERHLPPERDGSRALHNAETIADARSHHLARIAELRGKAGRLRTRNRRPTEKRVVPAHVPLAVDADDDPDTPLAVLLRELPADRDRIEVMREHVEQVRADLRAQRPTSTAARMAAAVAPRARRPSVEELRVELFGPPEQGPAQIGRLPE
jgi:hypothetical protein